MKDVYAGCSWGLYIVSVIFAAVDKIELAEWLAVASCFFAIKEGAAE